MRKTVFVTTMLALGFVPALAMADSLTAEQERACRWGGGLTPMQVATVFESEGQYLGTVPEFADRVLVGYAFGEGTGAVVGYWPGSGGKLISYSLDVVGFDDPEWFGEDCEAISNAHRPR